MSFLCHVSQVHWCWRWVGHVSCTFDMACSKQSAVDYIKNAWSLLVDHLKNQELIAEKLEELKVFNIDNVRAVTSEKNPSHQTRNILGFVTQKGEKASYLFLKILDSERNRILPKNVKPDLHQWISCFSFRHDLDIEPSGERHTHENLSIWMCWFDL